MPSWNFVARQVAALWLISCLVTTSARAQEPANRFESTIVRFEEQDLKSPPAANGIVFVGSSSIRRWDLTKNFADLNVINRGFGGSRIPDSVHFCERIVLKYKPPVVVFYAGDNDLGRGGKPEEARDAFKQFVDKVHAALPETRIYFISIKPSLRRWNLIDNIRQANALVKQMAESDPLLDYIDIEPVMLGADGKPRGELFVEDGLHLNQAGYDEWAKIIGPLLRVKP